MGNIHYPTSLLLLWLVKGAFNCSLVWLHVSFKIRKNISSCSHQMKDKLLFCHINLGDDDAAAYPLD